MKYLVYNKNNNMKRLVLINFLLILSFNVWSQDKNYDWGISFKNLFMDYQSQNGGNVDAIKDYHHGFELGLGKKLEENVLLNIPFKYGNVNTFSNSDNNYYHKRVIGIDAQIQYQFQEPDAVIVPYLLGGLGGVLEFEGDFNVQAPIGGGLYFKAAPNVYVNWQSEYRFSFGENRNNLHHGIGFIYLLGNNKVAEEPEEIMENNDSDGDGIINELDLCPDIAGLSSLNGCPDTDGDGIADFQDLCPDMAGTKDMKGCPDTDGDGINDKEDLCPDETGTKENMGCPLKDRDGDGVPDIQDECPDLAGAMDNGCPGLDNDNDGVPDDIDRCPDTKGTLAANGCPDTDGDGVADPDDKCPEAAGLAIYNGCPDSDGDGLDDSIDKCPYSPGTVAANGCPEIKKEDRETLDIAMRAVQFDTGKNTLKSESYQILKQIANIMNRYPDYNLTIAGHTDNVGSASANQNLSEKRAKACYDYLVSQGVSGFRMSHAGFGESRPISDNNTLNGKRLNRRVEFNLVPR
jgi:outer membrane protein OmpA-like peptidoglycan-associated protein